MSKQLSNGIAPGDVKVSLNPFVPNAPFLYPLKTSENRKVFRCFQRVDKGCIENEWVKLSDLKPLHTKSIVDKKLALSIKRKLHNMRVNCHEISINKKVVPTIKAVDYQRADYWRAVTTSSKNRQSNSTIKRNIKLRSPKCQLNFKISTKILANQSKIQTKTQPETTSHPKHIVQTRNNDNISKNIKIKDATQGKLHKPPTANPPKKKLAIKCPLTKKQQINNLLTTQINLHTTQIHRGGRNKWNTSSIKVRQPIRGRLKPSIDKTSEHDSSYGNHLLFFVFYLKLFLNFRLFISSSYKYFRIYQ